MGKLCWNLQTSYFIKVSTEVIFWCIIEFTVFDGEVTAITNEAELREIFDGWMLENVTM